YHGKCENMHGHNYKVYAHAKGSALNEGGMLIDFGELKGALRKVCATLDHTNLNDLVENNSFVFDQNPSAERIAKYIFDKLKEMLPDAPLYAVDVFETATSRARYIAD
ncbi:MAG: 6-carboxytetrahydropterin synthase, partial [Spirochaetaceae bacterium]|nr:6-carboxytetrahydropterin synthase [Spirochaetaceae bacterium]